MRVNPATLILSINRPVRARDGPRKALAFRGESGPYRIGVKRTQKRTGRERHVRGRDQGCGSRRGRFGRAIAQGRGLRRGRGGRRQSPRRLGRHARHHDRGGDVAVPPLRRDRGAWPFTTFPSSRRSRCATPTSPSCWCCASCCFRWRRGFATASAGGTSPPASTGAAILIYAIEGGEDFTDRATLPTQLDVVLGVIFIVLLLEATRRTTGWIVPFVAHGVHRLRLFRAVPAAAMDAPRLRRFAARRPSVHHARGHFRHPGRRVVVADHPVHDLRRVPAAFRRRQVLHRLFAWR